MIKRSLSNLHHAAQKGIFIFFIILSCTAFGAEPPSSEEAEDTEEMARLMEIIEEHTEIATKTHLNADYVPGMVTVLYGEELEAKGVQNVWEALGLVPGMEQGFQLSGGGDSMMRWWSNTRFTSNIKVLLNGVSMNVMLYADASETVRIPIELVERIEVIMTPGSSVYGEYAFVSVINIITRKDKNGFFAGFSRDNGITGGGMVSWSGDSSYINLSLSASQRDNTGTESGPDILYGMGMGGISNAPGPVNDSRDYCSVLLDGGYKNTTVTAGYTGTGLGDGFGIAKALSKKNEDTVTTDQYFLDARHELRFSPALEGNIRLGWMNHQMEMDQIQIFPAGYLGIYPDGMVYSISYEEEKMYGGIDMVWKGWASHRLLAGYSFTRAEMGDIRYATNYDSLTGEPFTSMHSFNNSVTRGLEGQNRTINSITFQDEFRINDAFTLTTGFRWDHYNDVGNGFSPRLAGVWRITGNHILKAQYSRAFRPPSFYEYYALNNPVLLEKRDLALNTADTYEIGYIYRKNKTVIRTTGSYSLLKNIVVDTGGGALDDIGEAHHKAFWVEIEHQLSHSLGLSGHLAYFDFKNRVSGDPVEGSINWAAGTGLMIHPYKNMAFNIQYRYVGDCNRDPADPRDDLGGYHTVDVTGSFFDPFFKGLTFRTGIKNLFDADVRTPSPMKTDLQGNPIPSYPDDYPHPGREWWVKLSYTF